MDYSRSGREVSYNGSANLLAQIFSGLILESNIWSLSHFFIALVKARLLNWLKFLECKHYFFQFFQARKGKREAREDRETQATGGRRLPPSRVSRASRLLCASFSRKMGACIEN